MNYPLSPLSTQKYDAQLSRAMRELINVICADLFKVIMREWQGEALIRALGHTYKSEASAPDVVRRWMDMYTHRIHRAAMVPKASGSRLQQRMIMDEAYRPILEQAFRSPGMRKFMKREQNRRFMPFDLTEEDGDPRPYVLFCHLEGAESVRIDGNTGNKIDRGELSAADILKLAAGVRRFTKSWGENAVPLALRTRPSV